MAKKKFELYEKHQTLEPKVELQVGRFVFRQPEHGEMFIENEEGEGGFFTEEDVEEKIQELFKEKL